MSRFLNELDAKELLSEYKIPMAKCGAAKSKEEAASIAEGLKFPIVMKVLSADIQHKTEAGCVFLGVEKNQIEEIFDMIYKNAGLYAPDAVIDGVLLEETAEKGLEVIVGMKKDAQFGPVIMVGLGGIYVEVIKDVALRLLPVTRKELERMLEETKLIRIIRGARGICYDKNTLLDVLLKIAKLAEDKPEVEEIDINPLFLYPDGCGAKGVDALIRMR